MVPRQHRYWHFRRFVRLQYWPYSEHSGIEGNSGLCFTLKGALLTIPLQAVFIIFGAITITWGAILFKLLPDLPSKSWFLTEDERLKAVVQVKET